MENDVFCSRRYDKNEENERMAESNLDFVISEAIRKE